MEKYLLDFCNDFGISIPQLACRERRPFQVRICMPYHSVQGHGGYHGKASFEHHPPYIWVVEIFDAEILRHKAQHHAEAETIGYLIVLLVGRQKHLLIVDEIREQG